MLSLYGVGVTPSFCTGSAPLGGDLNFFNRRRMVAPFAKAAFELKEIGNVSEVVETIHGLHIIKLTGKKEASTTSFEEVKDGIMAQQGQRKLRDLAMKYIEKLMAEAKIVYAPGMEPKPASQRRVPGAPGMQPKRPAPAAPGTQPKQPAPAAPPGAGDRTLQSQK